MKKISKLFLSFLLTALWVCSFVAFAGCGDAEWIEVQSVQYGSEQGSGFLWSTIEWTATCEKITFTEYESVPDDIKKSQTRRGKPTVLKTTTTHELIGLDREVFFAHAQEKIGDIYYYAESWENPYDDILYGTYYYKCTYKSYEINYVKVNFLDDYCIEINYNGEIIKTYPDIFDITYFND